MSGQLETNRFEALDALRGICALLVVLFHIPIYHAWKGAGAFVNLQFCVDIFFVLSGFVLCHAYANRIDTAGDGLRFMVMRFARLWPLHIVMLVLLIGVEFVKLSFNRFDGSMTLDSQPFGQGHSLPELVTNVLFLQSFGLHPDLSWNGPAWSAAVEFYVSMLFAAIVLMFPNARHRCFLVMLVAAGWSLYYVSPTNFFVSWDYGFLRAAFGFSAGCLAYDFRQRYLSRLIAPTAVEAFSLVAIVAFAAVAPRGAWQFLMPIIAAMVIVVFSFDQGRVSHALKSRTLQNLGLWSYSIYMIHSVIFVAMKMAASFIGNKLNIKLVGWHDGEKLVLLGTPDQALIPALILSVVVVVPFAALTYAWIEKPAMLAAKRLLRRNQNAETVQRASTVHAHARPLAATAPTKA